MSDLIDAFLDFGEIYEKYGVKGCLLFVGGIVLFIAIIIGIAYVLQ